MELLDTLSNLSENLQSEEHAVLCENILLSFINNNENSFSFTDYPSEVYEKIIGHLFTFISTRHRIMQVSLKVIRLLSRDKVIVTALSNAESYVKIFNEIISSPDAEESWKIEALKCSCNWVYHSNIIRNFLITCNISKNLIEDTSKCNQLLSVRTFYNVRILFLMSALEPSERLVMLENNAINVLTTVGNQVFNQVNQEGEKRFFFFYAKYLNDIQNLLLGTLEDCINMFFFTCSIICLLFFVFHLFFSNFQQP